MSATNKDEQMCEQVQAHALVLFQSALPEDNGPGSRASLFSLGLHAAVVVIFLTVFKLTLVDAPRRPLRVTMLHEAHLVNPFRPQPKNSPLANGSPSGGNHQILDSSKGVRPRPAQIVNPAPLIARVEHPRLQVSPAILNPEDAPHIDSFLRYGNPQTEAALISPGPGAGSIGSTAGFGEGSGDTKGVHGRFRASIAPGGFGVRDVSQAPVLIYKVDPDYSEQARLAKCRGTVLLKVVIDENGKPKDVRVMRPLGLGLDEKAVEAVQRWRFLPGLKDGKPVCVDANVEVDFRLL